MTTKDKRAIRAAIVEAAAKRKGCTVKEIYYHALPEESHIEVNLNKIPDQVVLVAKELLRGRHSAHPRPRVIRERYFRIAPFMSPC